MDLKDEQAMIALLKRKEKKYKRMKWIGVTIFVLVAITQGIFIGLNTDYLLSHYNKATERYSKGIRVPYRNVMFVIDSLLFVMFCVMTIMLCISVRMLRRFIIDHTMHKANEKTACLHFIMLFSLYFAGLINSILSLISSIYVIKAANE